MQVEGMNEKRQQNVGLRRHRGARRPSAGPLTAHRVMVVTKVAHRSSNGVSWFVPTSPSRKERGGRSVPRS